MEFRTFHIPFISGSLLKHISGLRLPGDGQHYNNVKTHLQNENQCENVCFMQQNISQSLLEKLAFFLRNNGLFFIKNPV